MSWCMDRVRGRAKGNAWSKGGGMPALGVGEATRAVGRAVDRCYMSRALEIRSGEIQTESCFREGSEIQTGLTETACGGRTAS